MNRIRLGLAAFVTSTTLLAGVVAVTARQPEGEPVMATPTAEHEALLQSVGTWDAKMTMSMGPDMTMEATGVEVYRAVGPFHVASDFTAEIGGMPYAGHGVQSWDPVKKAYVSVWVDSAEPSPIVLSGRWTVPGRTLEFTGTGMMVGQMSKIREVLTIHGPDARRFEMFVTPDGGRESKIMTIEYTRRK